MKIPEKRNRSFTRLEKWNGNEKPRKRLAIRGQLQEKGTEIRL